MDHDRISRLTAVERRLASEVRLFRAWGIARIAIAVVVVVALFLLSRRAHAQVVLGGPVDAGAPDAGPALYAHVDAGDPSPITGDVLNEQAERNLLARDEPPDAGAPCVQPSSDALDTALHIALVVVSAGAAVYVHQRIVK